MPQISTQEFERLPLRVHEFLAGVPLHDVWAVDLPRARSGITLDEFMRTSGACPFRTPPLVRSLLNFRFFVGRLFGWDREPVATSWASFATRLTTADRSRSLAPAGTREGPFRVVYRFQNELLLELVNRTAHAAALSALVETANAYRFYFGVYVHSVSRFTPIYMALIYPFRKLMVYPSLLRTVRADWNRAFGPA
ncbi:MAG TPA: DUF2867 domain-containing protein [Bryobacteraceae bacterium]|nr:DUF2867 domain-containing protein [Bryobacteraceae bacterium]